MDRVFFVAVIIGITSRIIMLNLDQKQYPTQPNVLLSQLILAFVASSLERIGSSSYKSFLYIHNIFISSSRTI